MLRKNKFEVRVSNVKHFEGSLIDCFLTAYGLADFVIMNHFGFCFTFHHVDLGQTDYDKDLDYDRYFYYEISQVLTSKELDIFKIKFRSFYHA